MCFSLDRLHVCTLFTDLQHYKFLLSRRLLETICWLSIFAKTLKANRVIMSATHLNNSVLLGPYLSVSISAHPSHFASVSTPNDTRSSLGWTVLYKSLYFVTRTSSCCLYSQECGSGLTTILGKRSWDSTASTFFMCRFYSWRKTQYSFTRMGKESVKFSKILISLARCIICFNTSILLSL